MDKVILSGNEAIARGAFEAGVRLAAAYPGTPSTEILENIATYEGIHAQWSPNEKVAFEVAIGANLAGAKALVAMKHVGLNVAADPLMTASYTGVRGGLVVISADDPGMHSSQNEQDNRLFAKFAKIPMLEPSDSQEAKDFVRIAFDLSKEFDTPVLIRMTTRVCHGKSVVELGKPEPMEVAGYQKDIRKNVMIPANARVRHQVVEERRKHMEAFAETFPLNQVEMNDPEMGIISSGVAYTYAKEVMSDASFLKLGLTYPLPMQKIQDFAARVNTLYVVEELEPFLEEQIRAMGVHVIGEEKRTRTGELSPERVRAMFENGTIPPQASPPSLPARPPVMCLGCAHRGMFHVLRKLRLDVTGDIGCYTLSALPPLEALHTCICMGASIGTALGIERAVGSEAAKQTVAVIGDSTFVHSGITGLVDAVYNRSNGTVIILDNSTTAMTGHQDHPATGKTLQGDPTVKLDLELLAKAVGVHNVQVIDPYDLEETERVVREEIHRKGPSVIIARHPCVLLTKERHPIVEVDPEQCTGCGACIRLGCPAIVKAGDKAQINALLCTGCGMCVQVCPKEAIGSVEE